MTAQEFLKSKEPNIFIVPEEWLEEYVNIVLSIAAEKARIKKEDFGGMQYYDVIDKNSIINCLKD